MLAIQRVPSMGSSKPPNQGMPFGYDFEDFPLPSPPEPAPGPSLLNDNDNKLMTSFFDNIDTNDFGGSMFPDSVDFMDSMGASWNDPPPMFVGSSTSYGQQPHFMGGDMNTLGFPTMNGHNTVPHNILSQSTSAEVLAAASVLQNGHNGRSHGDAMFTIPNSVSVHPRSQSQSHMMLPFSRPEENMSNTFFTEMMFGPDPAARREPKGPPKSMDINWGSDAGFGQRRFIAPQGQESIEAMEQDKMRALDCLEATGGSTAGNTRSNSPILARRPEIVRKPSIKSPGVNENGAEDERPKKRRKSSAAKDEDDEIETSIAKPTKKRRPKSMTVSSTPASSAPKSPPPSKRRKSTASSAAKLPRENLTEVQKRENHIRSEQKRRTLIKEGFDDLNDLVPDLKSGGFSKSAVLDMTANFLQDLIEGNRELQARLHELERVGIQV